MINLPLFPLHTVLFPGIPINLHIFEPRYKQMINLCVDTEQPFGVVLIQQGEEALGPLAEPHSIGCTAQIADVEYLDDGRINVLAIGMDRFRICSLSYDQPYLVGQVELLPLAAENAHSLAQAGQRLRPWVERYLSILSQIADDADVDTSHLPNDPAALAYLAAAVVQIPTPQKQTLLATGQATSLLSDIRAIYRREVPLLRAMIAYETNADEHSFSLN
ncbi:MAG: LON peptidase substrate-binding domain-containing protein [Anaerolineae bacterium]|jgi:Lon protease-like protein|nr:LON peptidase substrate-binding domain-containing protein [Anaerolineae bacterium]